ncbi:MAG: hypothetical protein AVDCRST_MAG45-2637 [uncultured Solirubrobacterales bacterium]|uniref:Uncharacterized protein n=1 Tax=uncultured Solirubrobacterales bacterium TaxID=768556 RepID=A0A6J4TH88_9ACTN|nr:MAG: hypothetical protein AVDCRST_MAG45-2637 [uncultured Solirubrobacterales bacterium]
MAQRAVAVGATLAATAGCSAEGADRPLPIACQSGQEALQAALRAAPRPVRLEGVRLSACFDPQSDAAELQSVGISFVGAAAALAERARERPESDAATQLGYLVGAMRRGAGSENEQGINTELVRRVEQELTLVDPDSRALRAGMRAGERTG